VCVCVYIYIYIGLNRVNLINPSLEFTPFYSQVVVVFLADGRVELNGLRINPRATLIVVK